MEKRLSFKKRFLCFLFLSLFYSPANSQITLWAYKDAAGKWGFKNNTEKIIIPAKYTEVNDFREGFASVQLNDKWGFIDKTGIEKSNNIHPTYSFCQEYWS